MRPPDVVRPHIRRPLLLPFSSRAVIEGMRHQKVHAPDAQPVDVPDHIPSGEMPFPGLSAAHAEAFVGVSAPSQVSGNVRAQPGLYGIELQKASGLRGNPAHDQILSRNLKIQLLLHIVAGLRMPHEGDPVRSAPAGKAGIKSLAQVLLDQPVVKGRSRILFSGKQRLQL